MSDRLKLRSEFSAVRENAEKQVSFPAVMLYIKCEPQDGDEPVKCGIICSRRFDKRAVYRNRARRLLFEAFRLIKKDLTPCRIIFIPRRSILDLKMQDVAYQMKKMVVRAGLTGTSRKSN